jgi:hypothetical protein
MGIPQPGYFQGMNRAKNTHGIMSQVISRLIPYFCIKERVP